MTSRDELRTLLLAAVKGGKGSGDFGHAGRPGKRGGSAEGQVIPDEIRNKRWFHATPRTAAGEAILASGEVRPPEVRAGRRGIGRQMEPVAGRIYLTAQSEYPAIYSLGGVVQGTDYYEVPDVDPPGTSTHEAFNNRTTREGLARDGRYGYIFELDTSKMKDIQPDEDSIGEKISEVLNGEAKLPWELNWLINSPKAMTDRQKRLVKDGDYATFTTVGKKVAKLMSNEEKMLFIEKFNPHIAHEGALPIKRAWRIDKKRTKEVAKDGSNLLEIAEEVPVTPKVEKSNPNHDKRGRFAPKAAAHPLDRFSAAWTDKENLPAGFKNVEELNGGNTIARYDDQRGVVLLTDAYWGHDEPTRREIAVHELAHAITSELSRPERALQEFWPIFPHFGHYDEKRGAFINYHGYPQTPDETITQTVADFMLEPDKLQQKWPAQYAIAADIHARYGHVLDRHGVAKALGIAVGVAVKSFDPNQPRDANGRWVSSKKFNSHHDAAGKFAAADVVLSDPATIADRLADRYEKQYGWDETHTRAGFVANWKKKMRGNAASAGFVQAVTPSVQKAIASGAVGNDVAFVAMKTGASGYEEGEYLGNGVIALYEDANRMDLPRENFGEMSVVRYPDSMESVAAHEYGHYLAEKDPSIIQRATLVLDDGKAAVKKAVSYYASTHVIELAAEAHAMRHHPDFDKAPAETRAMVEKVLGQALAKAFNPDEPRAADGRWTAGDDGEEYRDDPTASLAKRLFKLRRDFARIAQEVYNEWEQDDEGVDEEYGSGGICDEVARRVADAFGDKLEGVSIMDGGGEGDDHAWNIFYTDDGQQAVGMDIPPGVYETGGGYSWKKRKNIEITPADVEIFKMNPSDLNLDDLEKGFDPSERRDLRGRWTSGGGFTATAASDDSPEEAAREISDALADISRENIRNEGDLGPGQERVIRMLTDRPAHSVLEEEDVRQCVKEAGVQRLGRTVAGGGQDAVGLRALEMYEDGVDAVFKSWAKTVNKSAQSAVVNYAAQQEFGVKLSDWQTNQLDEIKDDYRQSVDSRFILKAAKYADFVVGQIADMRKAENAASSDKEREELRKATLERICKRAKKDGFVQPDGKPTSDHLNLIYSQIRSRGMFDVARKANRRTDDGYEEYETGEPRFISLRAGIEETRAILRAVYDETQAELRKLGIGPDDKVTLFRGISLDTPIGNKGDVVRYNGNAVESWTSSKYVADGFSIEERKDHAATLAIEVPSKNILSLASSGLGCLSEHEVIVLNGFGAGEARIVRTAIGRKKNLA